MNVNETLQILQALQACGASHFKSQDFEVSIPKSGAKLEQIIPPIVQAQAQQPAQPIQENKEATAKLQELIKTMSLPPEKLVDVIFPNGAEG
jgi:hypothetical protein